MTELERLIHDTNESNAKISFYTNKLADWLKENAKELSNLPKHSLPWIVVEYLKSERLKIETTVDNYVKSLKS